MQRKRIYLMTDYTSSSLWWWDADPYWDGGMVGLDEVPLTDDTKTALEAWSERMWLALNVRGGKGPLFDEEGYRVEMQAEGDRLWKLVRAELRDEYEVGRASFATGKKRIIWDPDEWFTMLAVANETECPAELSRLIEAVASADDPYEAALDVSNCATEFLATSRVASSLWHIWQALEDRYELLPEAEDARTFAMMRRAATEWGQVMDDPAARAAYLDRWEYEELGYKRLVPKGWDLRWEAGPDGSSRAEARSPDGNIVRVTASSWFETREQIRRESFAAAGLKGLE